MLAAHILTNLVLLFDVPAVPAKVISIIEIIHAGYLMQKEE